MNIMSNKKIKLYFKAFSPAFFWAVLIFLLSHQQMLPSLSLSTIDFLFKKAAHIFVYGVLYLLIIEGFSKLNFKFHKIWLTALIICLLYAMSDELHQSTVSGRTATLRDVGYDMLGVSLLVLKKFKYI